MNIPFDLTIFELVFIASLLFIASSIQGLLGYGFAVISSPILVQIDPVLVPALLSLLAFPLTIKIFTRERSQVIWSPMKYLLIGRLAGGPLGLICLIYLEQRILSITVGAIVLFAGLASYFGWTLERNFRNSFNAGMFSGIFAMIAGVGGPPIAILYRDTKGKEFRPSLNAVFTFGILITLTLLLIDGRIYQDHFFLFLYMIIPTFLGISLSSKLFMKVSDKVISNGVIWFSIISGLVVISSNIF